MRFVLTIILVCLVPLAHADESVHLGKITVQDDAEDSSPEAPSSFTTVIRPQAVHAEFRDLSELVSQSVGVNTYDLGGLGQFSSISIRGSSTEQVAVYLDGIRLNTGSTGTVDLSTIPVDIIDRIEVIRGGGGAQFGQDAIGGVLNILTLQGKPGTQVSATAGGGSFLTLKGGATFSHQTADYRALVSATHFQTKGDYTFKAADTTLSGGTVPGGGHIFTRIHNQSLSESVLAKGDVTINDHLIFQGLNDFFFTHRQLPGTEEETTLLYPANPLEAQENLFQNLSSVKLLCSRCGLDALTLSGSTDLQYERRHFTDPSPAIGNPTDFTTQYIAPNPFVTAGLTWTGLGRHSSMVRTDYRLERQTQSVGNTTTTSSGTHTRTIASVMAQDEWSLWQDRIMIIPVVRYMSASSYTHNLSAKLGVSLTPLKWFTLKANVDRAFRLPTFFELYLPDEGFLRGNPNLAKEKSLNWDVGSVVKSKRTRFELVYFQNRIENSIIFVPISATTIQPINTFAVRTQGIEATARLHPLPFLLLEGNYTWTRARFVSTQNQLPGRPAHRANIHLALDHKWNDRFKGSVYSNLQFVSKIPINDQNTVYIASRSQVDAGVTATVWKNWTMTVEGKDLSNVQIYDVQGFPLPRRSVFGSLQYSWGNS